MTVLHAIFYGFALSAIGSALFVVTARNAVRSVLALVVTFFSMAGVWMILHAEFLSLILLLVYVGAVMTLFLFVVMMLNVDKEPRQEGYVRYLPLGMMIVLLLTGIMVVALGPDHFGLSIIPLPAIDDAGVSNIQTIGNVLYTEHVYPFEIAGVLLLAAIIAAITLTYRGPVRRRSQNISEQVAATPKTSVRLVRMPSEPKEGNE